MDLRSTRAGLYPKILLLIVAVLACCKPSLSQEDLELLERLKSELTATEGEIADAEQKNSTLAGGLVKAFVEARLEILKTNKALIEQRIHAMESGADVEITVPGTAPDTDAASRLREEIEKQQAELEAAREDLARYSGGLVMAMKASNVATQEQTLAMLRQRYLTAEYGLYWPALANSASSEATGTQPSADQSTASAEDAVANGILQVTLIDKRFTKQDYQDFMFFDLRFDATGLDKAARAIKGRLNLGDVFGETKMMINWTLDEPLEPGGQLVENGTGFKYNQFNDSHMWARSTELKDMTATFTVDSILYQDGTRRDLSN